jgi:hypothetical protein
MSLPPDPPHYYDGMSINDFYTKYTNDSSVTIFFVFTARFPCDNHRKGGTDLRLVGIQVD